MVGLMCPGTMVLPSGFGLWHGPGGKPVLASMAPQPAASPSFVVSLPHARRTCGRVVAHSRQDAWRQHLFGYRRRGFQVGGRSLHLLAKVSRMPFLTKRFAFAERREGAATLCMD